MSVACYGSIVYQVTITRFLCNLVLSYLTKTCSHHAVKLNIDMVRKICTLPHFGKVPLVRLLQKNKNHSKADGDRQGHGNISRATGLFCSFRHCRSLHHATNIRETVSSQCTILKA